MSETGPKVPAPPQTLTLKNEPGEIGRLADFVEAFCRPFQPTEKDLFALHLALEEIVTNIINHGYRDGGAHAFTVALAAPGPDRIRAVVSDDAPPYDPLARPAVDTSRPLEERTIGGLGVHLIKHMMDSVHYERREGRNLLTLERTLRRPA